MAKQPFCPAIGFTVVVVAAVPNPMCARVLPDLHRDAHLRPITRHDAQLHTRDREGLLRPTGTGAIDRHIEGIDVARVAPACASDAALGDANWTASSPALPVGPTRAAVACASLPPVAAQVLSVLTQKV